MPGSRNAEPARPSAGAPRVEAQAATGPAASNRDVCERILDGLQTIIAKEGFSALTMGTLARRLRCSRTTLYKVAPSKDALVLTVLERIADASFAEAKEAVEVPGMTQAERISRWTEVLTRCQGSVSTACWLDVSSWEPSARLFERKSDRAQTYLSTIMDEGIRTGEFREMNGRFAAEVLSRGSRASRDPKVLQETGLTSGEAIAQLGAMFLKGIERR